MGGEHQHSWCVPAPHIGAHPPKCSHCRHARRGAPAQSSQIPSLTSPSWRHRVWRDCGPRPFNAAAVGGYSTSYGSHSAIADQASFCVGHVLWRGRLKYGTQSASMPQGWGVRCRHRVDLGVAPSAHAGAYLAYCPVTSGAPLAGDLVHNRQLVETAVTRAAGLGAAWILTPELCICSYTFADQIGTDWIMPQPDPWMRDFCQLAARLRATVFLSHPERDHQMMTRPSMVGVSPRRS
jgi:hypothetical protein